MNPLLIGIAIAVVLVVGLVVASVRIVTEYERGVVFRLGRILGAKGPGLFFIIPFVDRMQKINLRTVTTDIPPQDVITRDNVTVRVNGVSYFNVVDPVKAVLSIDNYFFGTTQVAQTTLRNIVGQTDLDDILINRDRINTEMQQVIDELTNPWGVKVTLVEIKDVELPEQMRRAMARQAEAERDRRAKIIHAKGELESAETLGQAAGVLEAHPAAMQLRVLSTMIEVADERNSTLIFPLPMELLRYFETAADALSRSPVPPSGGEPSETT